MRYWACSRELRLIREPDRSPFNRDQRQKIRFLPLSLPRSARSPTCLHRVASVTQQKSGLTVTDDIAVECLSRVREDPREFRFIQLRGSFYRPIMKNWSFTAPTTIGLGSLLVILIAQLPTALSKFETANDKLSEYVPDKWRAVAPDFKPPQIELHMLRDHVSKNTGWSTNLQYALWNNNNEIPQEKSRIDEQESEKDTKKDGTETTTKRSKLGSKTIIQVPAIQCPPGQKTDHLGRCRDIFLID